MWDVSDAADEQINAEARALLEAEQRAVEEADQRNPVLPSIRNNPVGCAQIVLDRFFTKDGLRQIIYYKETWYSYYKKLWSERSEDDIFHFVHTKLLLCRSVDAEGEIEDFNTCRANVSEIVFQIQQMVSIPSHYIAPVALIDGQWKSIDARGKMVCRGEVVDMLSGKSESNHQLFIPNGAEWEWNPKAKPSKEWLKFLEALFGSRDDEVMMLQEWFGYVMSGDTWAQKGLIIVGPKRAGKGIIGHILSLLLGRSMVSSPSLHSLGGTHGLENLVDKRMCLISDARLSNRQDIMAVIEVLLRLVANDPLDVNRKYKRALQTALDARVMMLSNEMPQLSDNSDAINSRFLILKLKESFYGREDFHLLDKLRDDLPSIAAWAVEGYRRLRQRGGFLEPKSSINARDEWYQENNPLSQFIEDRCELDPAAKVEMTVLFEAYKAWSESRGNAFMAANALSRRLGAMLGDQIQRTKSDKVRYISGIKLVGGDF